MALLEDQDGLSIVVVGWGQEERGMARLRCLAGELGIGGQVIFTGPIGREKLSVYYNTADVCVIPSFYESFGLVALEAMASGIPVIASRVGGLESTIKDGETGYLIPGHCPEPLAERVELLLYNEELHRVFSRAARCSVEEFTWSRVAEEIVGVYENVVARQVSLVR